MDASELVNPSLIGAAAVFILRQAWEIITSSQKKLKESLDQNTLAVHRLSTKLEFLEKKLEPIPRIQLDLNNLADKVRKLNARTPPQ